VADVLIGAADLFNWKHIEPWVVSARRSGFAGDIYLIAYRIDPDIYPMAEKYGVEVYQVDHTPYNTHIQHQQQGSPTQAHNLRFYHAWELLTRLKEHGHEYDHVIMTDARDVVFQKNPSDFLALREVKQFGWILGPSEHITFESEPWNKDNLLRGYGASFYNVVARNWLALNVGTIAGESNVMIELFHTLFRMTEGRHYPSDQSTFNVLARGIFQNHVRVMHSFDGWAAQLGTTQDPTKSFLWGECCEMRPRIHEDFKVYTSDGHLFTLVHQWDRVPELKSRIPELYHD
jgi:hypothetical protein